MNLSYCRFRNTAPDLAACLEHLLDDGLSEDERSARRRLLKTCREIVETVESEVGEWDGFADPWSAVPGQDEYTLPPRS